ncbi:hypothetical protein BV22DRAFT_1044444 [Leucogyrophana mollusca]|uniref:Uncharacterized protein n=1 Tax=Leucogyrophana mollusca TaxID=85980 RepID=A0ACB8BRQ3_9AGAM|nr:hypothetical protein BV22DRAFT_1044444 [Leucogyrophana mollusca]
MTKVASSKSISSSRANPMGSRPSQNSTSPETSANQAVGDIAKNYGDQDETEDHPMSPGITNSPDLPGELEMTPPPDLSSPMVGATEIDIDKNLDSFFLGTSGVNDSMHAPTARTKVVNANASHTPSQRTRITISTRTPAHDRKPSTAEIIKAQLATANVNRALTHHSALNVGVPAAHATPSPEKGFPIIHLSSPAQLLHFLSPSILSYWAEEVAEPKCLLRIFDYDGTDASTRASKLADLLRTTIISIAPYTFRQKLNPNVAAPSAELGREKEGSPEGFLLHQIPEDYLNILLTQRIWSTPAITFEACPFVNDTMPTFLFTLKGLSARHGIDVAHIVRNVWNDEVSQHDIEQILSYAYDLSSEGIYEAKIRLLTSIEIERLDFKEKGSIPAPRYNVMAQSPTTDPEVWTRLRVYLRELPYPSPIDGIGHFEDSFSPCGLCHSVAHPRGLCPFPNIPNWFGGGHTKETVKAKETPSNMKFKGKGKRTN